MDNLSKKKKQKWTCQWAFKKTTKLAQWAANAL